MPNDQSWANPGSRIANVVALSATYRSASGAPGGALSGGTPALAWSATSLDAGGEITITTDGTFDFTQKTNAAPMYYADPGAEGTLQSSPLSRRAFSLADSYSSIKILDTAVTHGPGGAMRFQVRSTATEPPYRVNNGTIEGFFNTSLDGAGDQIRLFSRHRQNYDGNDMYAKSLELFGDGAQWNRKLWRWWGQTSGGARSSAYDFLLAIGQSNTAMGNTRISPESTSSTLYIANLVENDAAFGAGKNFWKTEMLTVRNSSAPGVADAYCEWTVNGETVTRSGWVSRDEEDPYIYAYMAFPQNEHVYYEGQDWFEWYDVFYLDDTPHAVVISDQPTWGAPGAELEIVIPTLWLGNQIKGKFRRPAAGYLYILDGGGNPVTNDGVAIGAPQ